MLKQAKNQPTGTNFTVGMRHCMSTLSESANLGQSEIRDRKHQKCVEQHIKYPEFCCCGNVIYWRELLSWGCRLSKFWLLAIYTTNRVHLNDDNWSMELFERFLVPWETKNHSCTLSFPSSMANQIAFMRHHDTILCSLSLLKAVYKTRTKLQLWPQYKSGQGESTQIKLILLQGLAISSLTYIFSPTQKRTVWVYSSQVAVFQKCLTDWEK